MTSLIDEDVRLLEGVQNQGVDMKQQGRVRADAKGRVSLAKFLENSFPLDLDITVESDGKITLTPLATIPARELWLYKNPKALESLREGIEQVGNGNVKSRGSFAKYVEE
jgi:hypothetical protein